MPILNIKDLITKRVSMEMVPRKGNNEYAAEVLSEFIKAAGYRDLTIKSDQERTKYNLCQTSILRRAL